MASKRATYADHIVHNPEIMADKPIIMGTRIPAERIFAHLAHTPDLDDLFAAFPRLTIEDVQAALSYAHVAINRADVIAAFSGAVPPRTQRSQKPPPVPDSLARTFNEEANVEYAGFFVPECYLIE